MIPMVGNHVIEFGDGTTLIRSLTIAPILPAGIEQNGTNVYMNV